MTRPSKDCPSENDLADFLQKRPDSGSSLDEHLASCGPCRNLVFALASGPVESGPESKLESKLESATIEQTIGRFTIDKELGRGAMGVVFLADDPDLHRRVAIKFAHTPSSLQPDDEERMRREAQSLARLSHPNVVSVYETGLHNKQVYIVMEYVDGQTLVDWQCSSTPSTSEILSAFARAGEGLYAAHRAKLVHRDFKPGNIMISRTGEVKVTDFGLVRISDDLSMPVPPDHATTNLSLTEQVIGTPAYMAPEQLQGTAASFRSDQFSFCVALYEALCGRRPFVGHTIGELKDNMEKEADLSLLPPLQSSIRRALKRGLAVEPNERYDSMRELLKGIRLRPSRWKLAMPALAASGLLVFGISSLGVDVKSKACSGVERRSEELWTDKIRATTKAAFLAIDAPFAQSAWKAIDSRLKTRTTQWKELATAACHDALDSGQSPKLTELRASCFDRRWSDIQKLGIVLSSIDSAEVLQLAQETEQALKPIADCSDIDVLQRGAIPPQSVRARVEALDDELSRIAILENAGQNALAREAIAKALSEVQTLAYQPLLAHTLYSHAMIFSDDSESLEKTLLQAARLAAEAKLDELAAQIWLDLVYKVALVGGRYHDARMWAQMADAAILRAGNPTDLRSGYHTNMGILHHKEGKLEQAVEAAELGLGLSIKSNGARASDTASAYNNLATIQEWTENKLAAQGNYRTAIEIWTENYGAYHPKVAVTLSNLSGVTNRLGDPEAALKEAEHAISIFESTSGNEANIGMALANIGVIRVGQKRYADAESVFQRALDILRSQVGDEHPNVGFATYNLGAIAFLQGKQEEAFKRYKASRTLIASVLGKEHFMMATLLIGEGQDRVLAGQIDLGEELLEDALSVAEKHLPNSRQDLGIAKLRLAQLNFGRNNFRLAQKLFTEAFAAFEEPGDKEALPYLLLAMSGGLACEAVYGTESKLKLDDLSRMMSENTSPWDSDSDHAFAEYYYARGLRASNAAPEIVSLWAKRAATRLRAIPNLTQHAKAIRAWLAQ